MWQRNQKNKNKMTFKLWSKCRLRIHSHWGWLWWVLNIAWHIFMWQLGVAMQSKIHFIYIEINGNKQTKILKHFIQLVKFRFIDSISISIFRLDSALNIQFGLYSIFGCYIGLFMLLEIKIVFQEYTNGFVFIAFSRRCSNICVGH